jgi:hypothetical protein
MRSGATRAPLVLVIALVTVGASSLAPAVGGGHAAYSEAPPPAHTGGFSEPSCHICHFDNPLNASGGSVAIRGIPDGYEAGQRYRITVAVGRAGAARAGFQLSARHAEGAKAGEQAGVFLAVDARADVTANSAGVQYAHHTRGGTALSASDSGSWVVEWIAPGRATVGPVVFNVAANAANDDNSELGDFIYVSQLTRNPREK